MVSKDSLRRASFVLIMTAMSGCTATVNGGSDSGTPPPGSGEVPATCSQDPSVVGCVSGASGYSCTGTDSPGESDSALSCSVGTASSGATLYCCIDTTSVAAGCTADTSVMGCVGSSIGFSCTGSAQPAQGDSSLACSTGTPGSGATLFCCATYMASSGTCAQDATVTGCDGSSIGFSCSGSDTPDQDNASLTCSTGAAGGSGTAYCCTTGTGAPPTTTTTCAVDAMVTCASPTTGYSCSGGAAPTQTDSTLSCGTPTTEADGTTLAYCCGAAAAAPACATDPSVTGCPGDATGYTCTGGANPMTSSLLCGAGMAGQNGAMSYCCTPS